MRADFDGFTHSDALRSISPAFAEAYSRLRSLALRRNALSNVEREIVLMAANLTVHLHDLDAARFHLGRALSFGATEEQLRVVFLTGLVGQQTHVRITTVLLEELKAAGLFTGPSPELEAQVRAHKEAVQKKRDMGNGTGWDAILYLDPPFMERYEKLVGTVAPSRRMLELVVIAIDTVVTNLHRSGGIAHIMAAHRFGFSRDELLELVELVSLVGFKSVTSGVAAIEAALAMPASDPDPWERAHNYLAFDEAHAIAPMAPDYIQNYRNLQQAAITTGRLSEAERHLVYLALAASVHRNDASSITFHARRALNAGATAAEVFGVLRVAAIGMLTLVRFGPTLLSLVGESGDGSDADAARKAQIDSVTRTARARPGGVYEELDAFLHLDPEFIDAYLAFDAMPTLTPRVDALVVLAVACSPANPLRELHAYFVRRALESGLTTPDLSELLKIVSMSAYKTPYTGAEAIAAAKKAGPLRKQGDPQGRLFARPSAPLPRFLEPFETECEGLERTAMRRNAISAADRQIILFALHCIVHHGDRVGAMEHARAALDAGAGVRDLYGALILGGFGLHIHNWATRALLAQLEQAGVAPAETQEVLDREEAYYKWCTEFRGYDGRGYFPLLRLEHDFVIAYHKLTALPLLSDKLTELIIICGDSTPVHLAESGARIHIRKGISVGLDADALIEALELASLVGLRGALAAIDILSEKIGFET